MKKRILSSGISVFNNKIFEYDIFEENLDTKEDIKFTSCVFKKIVSFDKIKANYLSFVDCKFEKPIHIKNSSFFVLSFNKCIFLNNLKIISNNCSNFSLWNIDAKKILVNGEYHDFSIKYSKIDLITLRDVNSKYSLKEKNSRIEFLSENKMKRVDIKSHSNYSDVIFKGGDYQTIYFEGVFNNRIYFEKEIKNKNLFFESSIFKNRIEFQEGIFKSVYFYRSYFEGLVNIEDFSDFNNSNIVEKNLKIKEITIHSSEFEKDLVIQIKNIEHLNLSNNNFKQLLRFNNYTNKINEFSPVIISIDGSNQGNIIIERVHTHIDLSDINFGNIFIKDSIIDSVTFKEFQNKGNISLTNIKKGNYFTIQDSITGKLNFLNTDINIFKEIVITNSNILGIDLSTYPKKIYSYSNNPVRGYGLEEKTQNRSNLKNIYNQLKQIAKKKGNTDKSNHYQSLEHKQLLLSRRISTDSILLFLNWISNKNGRSWFRGVIFTLIIGFGFFTLYLHTLGLKFNPLREYKNYILFMSSFPKLQLEQFSELNKLWNVSFIIWLSRIFISYGIYQTISAFRKYGKG